MNKLLALFAALLGPSPTLAETTVPNLLSELELLLEAKRPALMESFRPPVSVDEIASLENKYRIVLPDAVKALYLWHDGQDPVRFETFVNNMTLQPLSEVFETKAELDGMIGYDFTLENWWNPAWLPLFHNGGGDYLVIDLQGVHTGDANQILRVYHDWEYRPIIARDLETFLQAALSYHDTTPLEQMDEFHEIDEFLPALDVSFNASGPIKPLK
ncbi:SMI1/KNR4 family protein [Aliiroseovarius sp. 2305UL8-7]|uniref:SMI1/KNR4 family protein n=1 Tax=Aliiroseovarius conchicola TaxID=3121637 RepID=UPI003527EF66